MKIFQKWIVFLLTYTVLFLGVIIMLNYYIDPLQFYRSAFYEPQFSSQQRYQAPGLAKNYEYDRAIIGSSMTENFIPSYIDQQLGGRTIKLSIEGSSLKEQYLIAKLALECGNAKSVLWGIDYFSLRGDPDRVRDEQGEFPFFLYDQQPLNDLKYLLNLDTTLDSLYILGSYIGFGKLSLYNLDMLYNWSDKYDYGKDVVMNVWEKYRNGASIPVDPMEYKHIQQSIDENVVKLVQQYPEVEFVFYYPPYTILQHRYYYERNPLLFQYGLDAKQYIFEQIGNLEHVKIYDFQHLQHITYNLYYYKDLAHHDQTINHFIIDSIAKGEYLVTESTLGYFAAVLKSQVESFTEDQLFEDANSSE